MAIQSLFGPSVEDLLYLRSREQAQQDLARQAQLTQAAQGLGAFSPLLAATTRFSDVMARGAFGQPTDPVLRKAAEVQGIVGRYADEDLEDPTVLRSIAKDLARSGYVQEAQGISSRARAVETEAKKMGFEEKRVGIAEEQLALSQKQLDLAVENAARQNRLTDAQINQINAQIRNLDRDKFSFQIGGKDILGNPTSIVAINKTDPSQVTTIPLVSAEAPATPAAPKAGQPKPDKSKLGNVLFPSRGE